MTDSARAYAPTLAMLLTLTATMLLSTCVAGAEEGIQEPHFCGRFDEVLDAAKNDFQAVRGRPKHEGLGVWYTTVTVPEGTDCLVYAPPLRMYACSLYIGNRQSDADAAYNDAVASVRHCLPKGWKIRRRADALGKDTKAWRNPGAPVVHITSRISDAAAYLVNMWVEGTSITSRDKP